MSAHVLEVDRSNFDSAVIEGSESAPVLVDFWAPWCGPCRALGPILEKLAAEYEGRFTLAKINSDENPDLSARYGVRGIPNVKAFVNGDIVDEFSGALSEREVRAFLDRVVPGPAQALRDEAHAVYTQTRDAKRALDLLASASELDPANAEVGIERAAILADCERYEEARAAIDSLPPLAQMDDRVGALKAKLDLADGAAAAPSEAVLSERIAANANDLEARLQLGHALVARKDYRAALEHLLHIVGRDRSFCDDIARKTMLKVFELLGSDDPLVPEFRRKLASAMH